MSSLFVDRRDAHMEMEAGALVFRDQRKDGERIGTVPLAPVTRVFLRGNLTLPVSLLGKLGERGIGVVILSGRMGKPCLLLGRPHHDARRRVEQIRMSLDAEFCLRFARRLVEQKLTAQHDWLAELRNQYPQDRRALSHALEQLQTLRQQLEQIHDLEKLRGVEGAATSAYFSGLRPLVPASLGFAQRNRRPPRDPFNALLSLTYTLVHAELVMALHGVGLDPFIGYYHQLSWGRESLACDLMEPLRPLADAFCLQLVRQQILTAEHFSTSSSGCTLGKAGRMRYYSAYEENAPSLRRAIASSVQALYQQIGPHDDFPDDQPRWDDHEEDASDDD